MPILLEGYLLLNTYSQHTRSTDIYHRKEQKQQTINIIIKTMSSLTQQVSSSTTVVSAYTKHLLLSTAVACLGSLQYGYHMAELNAAEAVMSCRTSIPGSQPYEDTWYGRHSYKQCIPLDIPDIALVTSIFSIGGLVGSSIASEFSERHGRKKSSFINVGFFLAGSYFATFANGRTGLLFGRFISGVGAGSSIVNTPLFINEIASHEVKGFLGSLNQFTINIGILFTQVLAIRWGNDQQWRNLLFMGIVLAIVNCGMLLLIDESPKWLVKNGKMASARLTLKKLRAFNVSNEEIEEEIGRWIAEIKGQPVQRSDSVTEDDDTEEGESFTSNSRMLVAHDSNSSVNSTIWSYITEKQYRKSLLVVSIIMVGQQLCGINSIIFYGVSVISDILPSKYAVMINCVISLLNAIVTYMSAMIVDKSGRRPLLLLSISIMGVASFLISCGILKNWSWITIMAVFSYIAAFAIGLGPIPFLLISEVSQLQITTAAQSFGTILNWVATFFIGYVFPIINGAIGGYVFSIFGLVCCAMVYLVYTLFPETRGKKNYNEVWGVY